MRKIVVTNNVSLDGVMQAPGRADEDTRGGFTRGGWPVPHHDPLGRIMGQGMARTGAGPAIAVLGSGELVRSLRREGLIDEYVLLVHPLVLGTGRRLFPDGDSPVDLRLVDSVRTTTGVLINTYQPA